MILSFHCLNGEFFSDIFPVDEISRNVIVIVEVEIIYLVTADN